MKFPRNTHTFNTHNMLHFQSMAVSSESIVSSHGARSFSLPADSTGTGIHHKTAAKIRAMANKAVVFQHQQKHLLGILTARIITELAVIVVMKERSWQWPWSETAAAVAIVVATMVVYEKHRGRWRALRQKQQRPSTRGKVTNNHISGVLPFKRSPIKEKPPHGSRQRVSRRRLRRREFCRRQLSYSSLSSSSSSANAAYSPSSSNPDSFLVASPSASTASFAEVTTSTPPLLSAVSEDTSSDAMETATTSCNLDLTSHLTNSTVSSNSSTTNSSSININDDTLPCRRRGSKNIHNNHTPNDVTSPTVSFSLHSNGSLKTNQYVYDPQQQPAADIDRRSSSQLASSRHSYNDNDISTRSSNNNTMDRCNGGANKEVLITDNNATTNTSKSVEVTSVAITTTTLARCTLNRSVSCPVVITTPEEVLRERRRRIFQKRRTASFRCQATLLGADHHPQHTATTPEALSFSVSSLPSSSSSLSPLSTFRLNTTTTTKEFVKKTQSTQSSSDRHRRQQSLQASLSQQNGRAIDRHPHVPRQNSTYGTPSITNNNERTNSKDWTPRAVGSNLLVPSSSSSLTSPPLTTTTLQSANGRPQQQHLSTVVFPLPASSSSALSTISRSPPLGKSLPKVPPQRGREIAPLSVDGSSSSLTSLSLASNQQHHLDPKLTENLDGVTQNITDNNDSTRERHRRQHHQRTLLSIEKTNPDVSASTPLMLSSVPPNLRTSGELPRIEEPSETKTTVGQKKELTPMLLESNSAAITDEPETQQATTSTQTRVQHHHNQINSGSSHSLLAAEDTSQWQQQRSLFKPLPFIKPLLMKKDEVGKTERRDLFLTPDLFRPPYESLSSSFLLASPLTSLSPAIHIPAPPAFSSTVASASSSAAASPAAATPKRTNIVVSSPPFTTIAGTTTTTNNITDNNSINDSNQMDSNKGICHAQKRQMVGSILGAGARGGWSWFRKRSDSIDTDNSGDSNICNDYSVGERRGWLRFGKHRDS